ncbi:MAG: hypothetical protein JKY65_05140 [Planctomycetes bacterium]|nr:hypothetical protein [Planctomycetota bacterium]
MEKLRKDPKGNHEEAFHRVRSYLAGEIGLSRKQIGVVLGLAKKLLARHKASGKGKGEGVRGHYRKLGVDDDGLKRIHHALGESGLHGHQIDQALEVIVKLSHQVRKEGERFKLAPEFLAWFKKSDYTGNQIETMIGIARRVAHQARGKTKEDGGLRSHFEKFGVSGEVLKKVAHALEEAGLKGKQLKQTLGGMLRVIHKMRAEGEAFKLDPRLLKCFKAEIGLSDAQVETVVNLAKRLEGIKRSH